MAFVPPTAAPGHYDTLPQYLSRSVKSASESREWTPTIRGVTTALRITRILSGRSTPSRRKQQQQQHVASRLRHPAQITSLRLLCRIRAALGRQVQTRKKPKVERKKSMTWRKYAKRTAHDPKPSRVAPEPQMRLERVADIRLTTQSGRSHDLVRYNIKARAYQRVADDDPLLHLLTLPSRVIHRDHLLQQKVFARRPQQARPPPAPAKKVQFDIESNEEEDMDDEKEMTTLSLDVVTQEQLAGLKAQANPFNFNERVSQTGTHRLKSRGVQTDPPPDTYYSDTAGVSNIYTAYQRDHHLKLLDRRKLDKKQKINSVVEFTGIKGSLREETPVVVEPHGKTSQGFCNLPGLHEAAVILERMVVQNIYDDIVQDFMYWEDGGDDYHPMEGSLLPLWKFTCDTSRSLIVSDVCWSPVYRDLFAAAYSAGEAGGVGGEGMLCLYTLKNPSTPERIFRSHCGVTCVHFHPRYASLVAAGWGDGTVVVYHVRSTGAQHRIHSTPVDGKHLLPVTRVRWIDTEASEELSLYSVSLDGRVTHWRVTPSVLLPSDVLDLSRNVRLAPDQRRPQLQGIGTCLALKPDDMSQLLLGVDTGSVYQFSIACPSHSCTRYPAHTTSVRDVAWNHYHNKVFISCSLDWTVKIWLQFSLSPLMTLDLGGPVAGVQWAPYSSSVFVAVTDEGRVQVYDLFFRKSYPLCSQRLLHRRQVAVSCVALSPKHPVILVGGERGYLLALKLSPNLRKIYNNPRGFEQLPHKEIELCKIERLIALNRGLGMHSGCFRENAETDDKTRERTVAALTLVVKRKHPTDF